MHNKTFDVINVELSDIKEQHEQSQDQEQSYNNNNNNEKSNITYGLDDVPPWYLCIFMALQHYLTMIGAIVSIPFILTPALCMKDDDPDRAHIISTMIFVTAIVTYVQVTFGCRLPIVQGGTISFLVPTLAILQQSKWSCPSAESLDAMNDANRTELWQTRMRELSGAIMISALFQVFIGFFGIIGLVIRFVSPLTIVPTVGIVGLSLFSHAAEAASTQWGIACGTIILMTIFSQCMTKIGIPCLVYRKNSSFSITRFHLFKLFPVILTIAIMWAVCGILTVTDYFQVGHPARTDTKIQIMESASWFRIPYPFQWGWPTFSVSSILGMLTGVLACTVESLSYYPTVARMCNGPPPPVHVFNRGIGIEGLGTVLAGMWGSGNGTNTFGENVGTIGVTKVGSRRVIQYACVLMLLQGIIGKFGAAFIIIPEPVIGGIFCIMFGMIAAFGLSNLQYVDLNSARNLYIIGFSLFFALVLPKAMSSQPGIIQTGSETVNNILTVLFSTSIFVGGATGCLMDHLIPGTLEERGIIAWGKQMEVVSNSDSSGYESSTYDFPIGMSLIRRWTWLSCIPCMPTYTS